MKLTSILGAGLLAALTIGSAAAADAPATNSGRAGINIGTLTCRADSAVGYLIGSHRKIKCAFSRAGSDDIVYYNGSISRLGIDLGATGNQTIVWTVFAPGKLADKALAGNYFGATAEASVAVGLGVNALVGGMKHSVTLQPVSIAGQTGLNVALTGTSMNLKAE